MNRRQLWVGTGIVCVVVGLACAGCGRVEEWVEPSEAEQQQMDLPTRLEFEGTIVGLDGECMGNKNMMFYTVEFDDGRTIAMFPRRYILAVGHTYSFKLRYYAGGMWYIDYLEER